MDLYKDVFKLGEGLIQRSGEESGWFKTNPVIIGLRAKISRLNSNPSTSTAKRTTTPEGSVQA